MDLSKYVGQYKGIYKKIISFVEEIDLKKAEQVPRSDGKLTSFSFLDESYRLLIGRGGSKSNYQVLQKSPKNLRIAPENDGGVISVDGSLREERIRETIAVALLELRLLNHGPQELGRQKVRELTYLITGYKS